MAFIKTSRDLMASFSGTETPTEIPTVFLEMTKDSDTAMDLSDKTIK